MISSNFLDFLNCYDIKTKKDQKPKKGARAGSPSPTFKLKTLLLKLIFHKTNAKLPIVPQNLHDPAPMFQANTHQNTGQNHANLV